MNGALVGTSKMEGTSDKAIPMSTDAELTEPVRLDVVAALVETDAATALPGQATCDERRLADALHGEPEAMPGPEAPALSELLRLAEGAPTVDAFVVGLRQAFLIPDDSWPPPACAHHTDAFADVYRRLAVPGLSGESMARAQAVLHQLARGLRSSGLISVLLAS